MLVKEVMTPHVVSIAPEESAALAARLLARHGLGALPVCSAEGILRGMVTDRDIVLRCVAPEADPKSVPVKEIMSRRLAAVAPARLMARRQIRRLPVVAEGKVVGMVSLGDLAQCGRYEMEISRALTDISSVVQKLSE